MKLWYKLLDKSKHTLQTNCIYTMRDIQDSGKVWCKGSTGPIHAVRVENKIFATGKEENQTLECWVDGDILCVDLHEPKRETRICRKISLNLDPSLAGTLFNGFTHTKHADVLIVRSDHEEIEEKKVSGETYKSEQYQTMSSHDFWNKLWQ